ncbi:MAG: DinB family protein [Crocinitomicaceae bacterium]
MKFEINKSIEILDRTPLVLKALLSGLPKDWLRGNEGENTWSPYNIVGHLIHNEKTDWIPRINIILSDSKDKTFIPFDRFAQMRGDQTVSIEYLLDEFKALRIASLDVLKSIPFNKLSLLKKGIHPELGEVTLKALLSAWVVHDLGHISQITRVMAKQYKDEVGPWVEYISILK